MAPRTPMYRLADERHRQLMAALDGIHERLDALNGRTRRNETDLATITERVENLRPGRQGGIAGMIGGVVAGFLAGLVKP